MDSMVVNLQEAVQNIGAEAYRAVRHRLPLAISLVVSIGILEFLNACG